MEAYSFEYKDKGRTVNCIYIPKMNIVAGFKDYYNKKGVIVQNAATVSDAKSASANKESFDLSREDVVKIMKFQRAGAIKLEDYFDESEKGPAKIQTLVKILTGESRYEGLLHKIWRCINLLPKNYDVD